MKKSVYFFIVILVLVFLVSTIAFVGCKEATETTEAAAEETDEEKVAEEAVTTGEVVAEEVYDITFIIYGDEGNPFWNPVLLGIKEMSEAIGGMKVDIQYAAYDAEKQINIIETAINNKVDGIALSIFVDDSFNEVIQKALDDGIPVVALNVDDSRGAEGSPRLCFVGQDFVAAGNVLASNFIEKSGIKSGDHVACPVEIPGAFYAQSRYQGVKEIFDANGITHEIFETTATSQEECLTRVTEYLLGHSETDAVCSLGGLPTAIIWQATQDVGMDIPCVGFDITQDILQQVIDGKLFGCIDQKPYYQGSLPIHFLWALLKYGIEPCNVDTGSLTYIGPEEAPMALEWGGIAR